MIVSWSIALTLGLAPAAPESPSAPTEDAAPESSTAAQDPAPADETPAAEPTEAEAPSDTTATTEEPPAEASPPAETEQPPETAETTEVASAEATVSTAEPEPDPETSDVADDDDAWSDEPGEDDDGGKKKKGKKKNKLSFKIAGRVMAGWETDNKRPSEEQTATAGWANEFFLRQARVKLGIDYAKIFRLRMSIELADALKNFNVDRISYLRNGYAEARFHKTARLRFGYFKRPFSRLELRSPTDLPFRGRGLANDRIIEDRNYGDRSVGGMLHGKIDAARLRYAVGVFAPARSTEGVDAVARLTAKPWKWLSIGAGGLYKRVENGTGDKVDVGAAGADFRVKYKGFQFLGDFIMGRDYLVPGEPWSLGIVGYTTYDIDLPKKFTLQPVVLAEWTDIDIGVSQNDAVRAVAGVNLLWRKRFRIMPQAEFIRPMGVIGNPFVEKDTYYVMLAISL
ncbi:MAG: porin [Myxococcota bacterium]